MVKLYEDETRVLLSKLFGGPTGGGSPHGLALRTAIVEHNKECTYVVPGDWPPVDGSRWFVDRAKPPEGSDVHCLLDGPETLEAYREAMKTAERSSHFIVLLGWSLAVHTPLTRPGSAAPQSFLQVVEERAALGVPVRVLLWDNPLMQGYDAALGAWVDEDNNPLPAGTPTRTLNENAKRSLEKLRTSKSFDVYCNLDDRTNGWVSGTVASLAGKPGLHSYGAHHQKILLVYGTEGLIGFCGGIDIDPNRISYLHDLQARVQGSAAEELWKIAEKRWSESRDNGNPPSPVTISVLAPASFAKPPRAPYLASVVQTVGNPDIAKSTPNTLWPAIQEALQRATRYIYMEDQYFWSLDLVDELVAAAGHVEFVTIVLPAAKTGEATYKRHAAITALKKQGKSRIEKIGLYQSEAIVHLPSSPDAFLHDYLHAKLFVVDDEYAIITSANANNRGYFLDSEVAVGVAERAAQDNAGARQGQWSVIEGNFARRLRIRLWAEHLGLEPEEVFDWLGAHVHWLKLPSSAQVKEYRALNFKKMQLLEAWEKQVKGLRPGEPPTEPYPGPWDKEKDNPVWGATPPEELEKFTPLPPSEDAIIDPKSGF